MKTMTKKRAELSLRSGETYQVVFRRGIGGLEGGWDADAAGEYRPFVPCSWVCHHGGVMTSRHIGDGRGNIDHGTITITLADGRAAAGTYYAGDRFMSVTID
jgi:hypothetical protein